MIATPIGDVAAAAQLAASPAPHKALFLDRDGVINVDHGYVHEPAATEWVPGIFEACAHAHAAGYLIVVVTNQAGIARGYYDVETFRAYTHWMHAQFAQRGAPLLATCYCPHHPAHGLGQWRTPCACRKPQPGMLLVARDAFAIDLAASVMVGDQPSDEAAARAAGIGCYLMGVPALSHFFHEGKRSGADE